MENRMRSLRLAVIFWSDVRNVSLGISADRIPTNGQDTEYRIAATRNRGYLSCLGFFAELALPPSDQPVQQ